MHLNSARVVLSRAHKLSSLLKSLERPSHALIRSYCTNRDFTSAVTSQDTSNNRLYVPNLTDRACLSQSSRHCDEDVLSSVRLRHNRHHNEQKQGSGGIHRAITILTCGLTLYALSDDFLALDDAQACGIIAFASENTQALEVLLEGLRILQNRGYDSVGIATLSYSPLQEQTANYASDERKEDADAVVPRLGSVSHETTETKHASQISITKVATLPDDPNDCVKLLEDEIKRSRYESRHRAATCGIAHTRWATHGGRTHANAHPHADWKDRIALVHNGTIENFAALKAELCEKGIPFRSETDSEVIANLIGIYLDAACDTTLLEATNLAVSRLRGTWALAIVSKDNLHEIVAACAGCPLVVARIPGMGVLIASEPSAFACYIAAHEHKADKGEASECFQLVDGAAVALNATRSLVSQVPELMRGPALVQLALRLAADMGFQSSNEHISSQSSLQTPLQSPITMTLSSPSAITASITSPDPYPHWTIREIYEQPEALMRAITAEGRMSQSILSDDAKVHLPSDTDMIYLSTLEGAAGIRGKKHAVLTACGTSLYACEFGAQLLRRTRAFQTVQVVDAAEFTLDVLPNQEADAGTSNTPADASTLVCVVSQSGETKDTQRAANLARDVAGVSLLGIVNQRGSLIARTCGSQRVLYTEAGREWAVASTKAFITQGVIFALLSAWYMQADSSSSVESHRSVPLPAHEQAHAQLFNAIQALPKASQIALQQHDQIKELAQSLKTAEHMFVLGRGLCEPIAREGALKVKEITYIHAEGCSGGTLKHGPFALLSPGIPVILLIPKDANFDLMMITAQEVKARGAYTIIITDVPHEFSNNVADAILPCPTNGPLTALTMVVPIQLLAYELAVARGINPDRPRNLAKAVTVD